ISEKVAQLRSLPLGEVIKITNNNSKALFGLDK
ncbi:hydrolase TatD, partial [Vibrio cholerae]|nr:hydrolase TatD [Vibrio cholerae]